MTGYGKGIIESDCGRAIVELRSVNNRFLDLSFRLPRGFQYVEDAMRSTVSAFVKRGRVEIVLVYECTRPSDTMLILNEPLAKSYLDIASKIEGLGFNGQITVADLIKIPDVVSHRSIVDDEKKEKDQALLIIKATKVATDELILMRQIEGSKLNRDLKTKLADLSVCTNEIAQIAPKSMVEHRQKLLNRIFDSILSQPSVSENKIYEEVAFIVDKLNIDEEITRIKSHLEHFDEILHQDGLVGKKLDFLTHEINREVNTIASKANNYDVTRILLDMKNIVEMMREQIQNIE